MKYKGSKRTRAVILNIRNKERIVSVTNLLPVYAETLRLDRFDTRQVSVESAGGSHSECESSVGSSDDDHKLPPGVVLLPGSGHSTGITN